MDTGNNLSAWAQFEAKDDAGVSIPLPQLSQTTKTDYTVGGYSTSTTNSLASFAHRPSENVVGFLRSQLDLIQQSLQEFMLSLSVTDLDQVMNNEKSIIDLAVRRLQISLAQTFLVPSFDGIVTAVYKDPGENVAPGEAVIRIEDPTRLYLVGVINSRTPLNITPPGQPGTLTVVTKSIFEDAKQVQFAQVAIRSIKGHDSYNDDWQVVLECANQGTLPDGTTVSIPINYHFDPEDTVVVFP